jgi:hypothetical protein
MLAEVPWSIKASGTLTMIAVNVLALQNIPAEKGEECVQLTMIAGMQAGLNAGHPA